MTLRNFFQLLIIISLAACIPATVSPPTSSPQPSPQPELPDLAVAQSISSHPGDCIFAYEIRAVIENRGHAPATDVFVIEQSTGYTYQIGTIEALHSMEIPVSLNPTGGSYTLVIDPHNVVKESDETNNIYSFFGPALTPSGASPHPSLDGLTYANLNLNQIWEFFPAEPPAQLMEGTTAQFTPNGQQALFEASGDLWLAKPMEEPSVNLTSTLERYEQFPQWWSSNPAKIIFNSMDSKEAREKNGEHDISGYLSTMNNDGSEYVTLSYFPSYARPAPSPDGKTIAYDALGMPMLYKVNVGASSFAAARYGYQTKNAIFTNPSFSPDGRWLTWWTSEGSPEQQERFSLVIFDLNRKTSAILHSYTPTAGTSGWLDTPRWSPDGRWIAFQTRDEVAPLDLWVIHHDGDIEQRFGLATNPVWSPDSQRLAYARQPSHSDLVRTVDLSVIDVPSWNIWQNCLPGGEGIPLAWLATTP